MSHPPIYTTDHALDTGPAPDPQKGIQVTPGSRAAVYFADLEAALAAPLPDDSSPWSTTVSRMQRGLEGAVQDPGQAHRRQWKDLDECAQWILAGQRIGPKHEQPCLHTGIVRWPGDTHKANCAGVQSMYFDLDGAIDSPAELELVTAWARAKGCHILHSSASHDPSAGVWRIKILLRINATLSYEVAGRVARILRQEIADALGRPLDNCIDACTERAMQVQLVPAWRDQARADQAIFVVHRGPCADLTPYVAVVREEMDEEARLIAAKAAARKEIRKEVRTASAPPTTQGGTGTVDPLEGCRRDLERFAIRAGCGERNRRIPVAVGICVEWGLDLRQAEQAMLGAYGSDIDAGGWIGRWVSTIYAKPDTEGRHGRRLALAQTRAVFSAGGGFGVGGDDASAFSDTTVRARADLAPSLFLNAAKSAREPTVVSGGAEKAAKREESEKKEEAKSTEPMPTTSAGPARIHARYLPEVDLRELALKGKFHLDKSPCGTGKNFRLAAAFAAAAAEGEMLVATSCRQSLCASMAQALGLVNYQNIISRDITVPTAVCLDSLPRVPRLMVTSEGFFEETRLRVLLLDEVQQTFRHMFGSTISAKNQVGVIWSDLKAKIANSELVIAQDADLDYLTLFALSVMSGEPITSIQANLTINTWRDKDLRVSTYQSDGAWWRGLLAWAEASSVAVFCTTKNAVRKFARDFQRAYPAKRVLVVDGDRGGDDGVQRALKDSAVLEQYDAIFYNTAWGTGISIDLRGKFRVYGYLKAVSKITAQDCRQGLSRVRHPVGDAWHVRMCGSAPKGETDQTKIMEHLLRPSLESMRQIEAMGTGWSPIYRLGSTRVEALAPDNLDMVRVWAAKEAYENEWGGTYHSTLLEDGTTVEGAFVRHLQELGIPLVDAADMLEPEKEAAAEADLECAKKAEEKAEVERWIAARHTTDEEIEKLEAKPRTLETTAIIQAHKLKRFYGWSQLDAQKIAWDNRGRGRQRCRTYQHVLEIEAGNHEPILAKDATAADTGYMVQFRNLAVEADTMLALWRQVFGVTSLRADAVAGTVLRAKANILANSKARDMLACNLGMHFSRSDQNNIMSLARGLAARIGVKLKQGKMTRLPSGKRVQEYSLDPASFLEMDAFSANYREALLDPQGRKKVPSTTGPTPADAARTVALILEADFDLAA